MVQKIDQVYTLTNENCDSYELENHMSEGNNK